MLASSISTLTAPAHARPASSGVESAIWTIDANTLKLTGEFKRPVSRCYAAFKGEETSLTNDLPFLLMQ